MDHLVRLRIIVLEDHTVEKHKQPTRHEQQAPTTPAQLAKELVTSEMEKAEEKVHICEERNHGWHVDADLQAEDLSTEEKEVTYPGGEGMSEENWEQAGGDRFEPNEGEATPDEQMYVDYKWQEHFMHVIPDQEGCWPGGY